MQRSVRLLVLLVRGAAVALVLSAAAVGSGWAKPDSFFAADTSRPTEPAGLTSRKPALTIGARVTSVVDGDTIRVRSLGPRRRSYTVRLVGIDAPEAGRRGVAGECGGLEAVSSVYALAFSDPSDTNSDGFLDRGGGQGRKVTVTTDPAQPSFDRRRRLLAYVTPRGRKMLQLALLEAGWARVSLVRGKALQHLRSFRRSSARARRAPRGMFDACGGNFHKRAPARAPKRTRPAVRSRSLPRERPAGWSRSAA